MMLFTIYHRHQGKTAHFIHHAQITGTQSTFLEEAIYNYLEFSSRNKILRIEKSSLNYDTGEITKEKVKGYEQIYNRLLQEYRERNLRQRAMEGNSRRKAS